MGVEEVQDAGTARDPKQGFPFYYGWVIDKVIVMILIAFWWIVAFALIVWAVIRTLIIYAVLLGVLAIPILIGAGIGFSLFLVSLYWTPSISVALTEMAPLLQAGLEIGTFALSVAWFILIALVQLWNILIPLFVLIFIHTMHFILTVITEITKQLTGTDLTSLFTHLTKIAYFFADIILIILTTIIGVLPSALSLLIRVLRPILQLFFGVLPFLFDVLKFLFLVLFKWLPSIFFSVVRLVRYFSSLLRSVPGLPSESSRYQAAVDAYFNEMVDQGRDVDWDGTIDHITRINEMSQYYVDYSHLPDPFAFDDPRRRSDSPVQKSRGSLHARFAEDSDEHHHTRAPGSRLSPVDRGNIFAVSVQEGLHAVLDTAPSVHVHLSMLSHALDTGARTFFGYESASHALHDYNRRYGHPAQVLLRHVPDIHGSWLGRFIISRNPDHPVNAGMSHHAWRRAGYPPVSDHPNADAINEEIRRSQPQILEYQRKLEQQRFSTTPVQAPDTGIPAGQVPLPFEMPVILGGNCYSKPMFILCLPVPSNRRFKAPQLLIPTNLADPNTCKGFIAPPNPDHWWLMFSPRLLVVNSWTYFRYILSLISTVFYGLAKYNIVGGGLLADFAGILTIGGISDGPLTLEEGECLIPFAWFPFITAAAALGILIVAPPLLWMFFSWFVAICLPFFITWSLVSRLMLYYRLSAKRVKVMHTRKPSDVAEQKWWRERSIMRNGRGQAETMPGGARPANPVGEAEQMRSDTYSSRFISDEIDGMSMEKLHLLRTMRRDRDEAMAARDYQRERAHALINAAHGMGCLSRHVSRASPRYHLTTYTRLQPIVPYHQTLSYLRDRLNNVEVMLGHRPLEDAVPLAHH